MLNLLARLRERQSIIAETGTKAAKNAGRAAGKFGSLTGVLLLALTAGQAFAGSPQKPHVEFVNVADSTQGLAGFSQFPAINRAGAVAFVATQTGVGQGVFRSEHHELRTIASTADNQFTFFADNVVINASGVVGFQGGLNLPGRVTGIFTSDGVSTRTIVNSLDQGLPGPAIGAPSINASGTVAFFSPRNGFRSSIIFTGNGGPLTPVLDTLNTNFGAFGAVAINASGRVVFRGILKDRNEGIFVATSNPDGTTGVVDLVDSNNPDFFQFGDPVISDTGIAAAFTGVATGLEVISATGSGVTARTDAANGFADIEHPSINNRGAVAFSVLEADGSQGIFVELTGGASPVAILQTGDPLFGSRVTGVSVGRFAFNDHLKLVFEYELEDGRSGIAVASLHGDDGDDGDRVEDEK